MPREALDKLVFEEESKEKAAKEAKIVEDNAEKEKAKKGKVFTHLSGGEAKPPAPPSAAAVAETTAAAAATAAGAAAAGVEERYIRVFAGNDKTTNGSDRSNRGTAAGIQRGGQCKG